MPVTFRESSPEVLGALAVERDIRRQLHNYCRAVDRLDLELLKSVWHPDGTLDFEEPTLRGLASGLLDGVIDWYRQWTAHSHQITNWLIEVKSDRAVSEVYVFEVLRSVPDATGPMVDRHLRGRYLDHWSRRDRGWAIDHRQALRAFSWEQAPLEGRIGERSRRDRQDPAYDLW